MKTNDLKRFADLIKKAKIKNTLHILDWLYVKNGVITFSNLDVIIQQHFDEMECIEEFYIPVQNFIDLMILKNKDISFSVEGRVVTVDIGGGLVKFDYSDCFDSEGVSNYLTMDERFEKLTDIGTISTNDVEKIKRASNYCEKSPSVRPVMEAVYVDSNRIVGANANWLAYYESDSRETSFMIPTYTTKLLEEKSVYFVSQNDKSVNLYNADSQLTINYKRVEGNFPRYQSVIPSNPNATAIFDAKDFIEKYDMVKSIFGKALTVKAVSCVLLSMQFTDDKMVCVARQTGEDRTFEFSIPAGIDGNFIDLIGVNMEMLYQIIKNERLTMVEIELWQPNRAMIINKNVLLMPMIL